ncbi:hypothetical protein LWC33_17555 [Pseudonocardia sp. RS11V-5]|uniref:hypothetical protein n=1 Tax=Pseudonocardia terrae TaxID=2905831 RepID=UPI001E5B4B4D|nr:hypothetical protein [Pseudonocardia terrae]MCE3553257.1 hypothetical protein [Pseudonocardia terrae]
MSADSGLKHVQKALDALGAAGSPLEALAAARDLRCAAEEVERRRAAEAREAGASWSKIGALYGTTKQNVQQRFGAARKQAAEEPA